MGVIAKGILRGCQGLFTPVSLGYPLSVFNKNFYSQTLKSKDTQLQLLSSPNVLIPGKHRPQHGGVNCNGQRLRVEKMANIRLGFGRECLLGFYGEHNSKNRKGSCRDVT